MTPSLPPLKSPSGHEKGVAAAASLSSRLPRAALGYEREATDRLIAELATKQGRLEAECVSLQQQMAKLESELGRYREQEQLVGRALIAATSHATTIKDAARREAEQLLGKTRSELERRTAQAEQAERDRAAAERELARLRRLAQEMQSGLASFLTRAIGDLRAEEEREPQRAGQGNRAEEALIGSLEARLAREAAEPHPESLDVRFLRPTS